VTTVPAGAVVVVDDEDEDVDEDDSCSVGSGPGSPEGTSPVARRSASVVSTPARRARSDSWTGRSRRL
jgi:hypothetical protein